MDDLYDILKLPRNATRRQIRKAFRREALRCHPDRAEGDPSGECFRRVREAYEVLSDPAKRRAYDRRSARRGPSAREAMGPAPLRRRPTEPLREDGRRVTGPLSAPEALVARIFGGLFGPFANEGTHLEARLVLTRAEAARGGTVEARIPVVAPCEWCHGTGARGRYRCLSCEGHGLRRQMRSHTLAFPAGMADGAFLQTEVQIAPGLTAQLVLRVSVRG